MRTKHSQSVSQCMQASHNNNNTNKKYYIQSYTYIAYCFTFGVSEYLYIFSNRFDWASSKNNNNNHIRIQNYDSQTHRVLRWGEKKHTHTPDSHPLRRFNTRRNATLFNRASHRRRRPPKTNSYSASGVVELKLSRIFLFLFFASLAQNLYTFQ